MTSSNGSGTARLLGAVLLLAIGAAAALSSMVALGALAPAQVFADWQPGRALLQPLANGAFGDRAFAAGVSAAIGLVALAWLVRLLGGRREPAGVHLLVADDRGFVLVDSRGVATVAAHAARSTAGVVEASVRVDGSGSDPVRLKVAVGVHPGANIKEAGDQTRRRVQEAVERLVGVTVDDVTVSVHVMDAAELSRLLA